MLALLKGCTMNWRGENLREPMLFAEWQISHRKSERRTRILLMLMEDLMNNDRNSLYVLICSLAGTLISLPAVWYFTAAAYAPGLVA